MNLCLIPGICREVGLQLSKLQRSAAEHSSTRHCICLLHNLRNVLVQIANKMGFKKKVLIALEVTQLPILLV
jgi:hypothetical protein